MVVNQPLILLDTNIILYFLGGRLVDPLPTGEYFLSVITEIELLSYPSIGVDEEREKTLHKATRKNRSANSSAAGIKGF